MRFRVSRHNRKRAGVNRSAKVGEQAYDERMALKRVRKSGGKASSGDCR